MRIAARSQLGKPLLFVFVFDDIQSHEGGRPDDGTRST